MPANVQRFFEYEEPTLPRRLESLEDRDQRQMRASFGGWCG
jgi:hypothetical protein